MEYIIGVDTGGTFTDLICVDEKGESIIVKTPSTPDNPSLAVIDGIKKAANQLQVNFDDFLSKISRICHGTTVSTNTVLTWTGAKLGLLCTEGFRDVLEIRFGIRETPYDYSIPMPKPLAPRYLRIPIQERINWNGEVLAPLDESQVREACNFFKKEGVQAIVVSFLWAFKNPEHEQRAVAICREECPGIYVTGACEIQPEVREYWRTSTAVLSGYVGPNLSFYIKYLEENLRSAGFKGELLITQSNAGVMFPEIAVEQAVRTVLSGPASAPAAAASIAGSHDLRDVITVDMGGTSFDVCLIKEEQPMTTLETAVGGVYHLKLPMVDVHTVGSGGGSIAWLDKLNVLHVGPQSAGADPAPACYGKGGEEPTSTDADLVLGYLNPDYFLGGQMPINRELSERAIKNKIADPLGIDVVDAAVAIRRIIDHQMSDAISRVSVERGEDPRRYALVAAGGAGPLHVSNLAKKLEINKILIPRNSSVFCALGSVIADIKHDLVASIIMRTANVNIDTLNKAFESLENQGNSYLEREGIPENERYYERSIDMRYKGQFHEVEVPVSLGKMDSNRISRVIEDFNKRHEELYAYRDDVETEMINLRLAACGRVVAPSREKSDVTSKDASKYLKGYRDVYYEESQGFLKTAIYDGNNLKCGNYIVGPAVIEQKMTNIVVPPDAETTVTEYEDFIMLLK